MENVAVIGASENEERYSYKAIKMLEEYGHNPIPVAPAKEKILGKKAYGCIADIEDNIDTVTVYIGPQRQEKLIEELLKLKPKRVIFNPGTENLEAFKIKTYHRFGEDVMRTKTLFLLILILVEFISGLLNPYHFSQSVSLSLA